MWLENRLLPSHLSRNEMLDTACLFYYKRNVNYCQRNPLDKLSLPTPAMQIPMSADIQSPSQAAARQGPPDARQHPR